MWRVRPPNVRSPTQIHRHRRRARSADDAETRLPAALPWGQFALVGVIRKPLSLMFSQCGKQNVECWRRWSNRQLRLYVGCEVSMTLDANGAPRAAHLPPLTMEQVGWVGFSVGFSVWLDSRLDWVIGWGFRLSWVGDSRLGSRLVWFSVGLSVGLGWSWLGSVRLLVLSSQFSVLSSRFSVLGSWFSVLGSRFSVLNSRFSVLGFQFSVLGSWFGVRRSARPLRCAEARHRNVTL